VPTDDLDDAMSQAARSSRLRGDEPVRQLAVRARRHVDESRPRFETSREQRDRLADSFFAAVQEGDLAGLESVLADDVELHGDGGGKVPALARALHGRVRVARTLLAWSRAQTRIGGATVRRTTVNGQPGALVLAPDGKLISVITLDVAGRQIRRVSSVVNPEKLGHLGAVADMAALLRGGAER
jgi:ketosteroid isomerase-like protein